MPATKAKEHPIIFNEWSINRILADAKTQTRRIIKTQPSVVLDNHPEVYGEDGDLHPVTCPYGTKGDILWVREAFRLPAVNDSVSPSEYVGVGCDVVRYEADGAVQNNAWMDEHPDAEWGRLRPSIHMPRELCRLRLRVEDVCVERVQDITPSDIKKEGIEPSLEPAYVNVAGEPKPGYDYYGPFIQLWNDIHGQDAWERNEWVWVVVFSRINNG